MSYAIDKGMHGVCYTPEGYIFRKGTKGVGPRGRDYITEQTGNSEDIVSVRACLFIVVRDQAAS